MADDFQINHSLGPGQTVLLRLSGRLDAKSASLLMNRCQAVRGAEHHLVLNLSGVYFIASSGVGALLALAEQFKDSRGSLRLVALSSAVESVIRLLNLGQFLTIDASEDEALTALAAREH